MGIFNDLLMYTRFISGLPGFLLKAITLEDARKTIKHLLNEREVNFLRLMKHGVYAYPDSPYLPMLERAGCEYGDMCNMVRQEGIEKTLLKLRKEGVYVTFEECKGRRNIIRDGMEIPIHANSFDNPFPKAQYYAESGGSTGVGTRVQHDLDHMAVLAAHEMVTYGAHGVLDYPKAIWRGVLPDSSGFNNTLRLCHYKRPPQQWFSPIDPYTFRPLSQFKYHAASLLTVAIGRMCNVSIPWPKHVPIKDAQVVARWAAETLQKQGNCFISVTVSRALRVCLEAEKKGLDLTGTVFRVAGEPLTSAKIKGILKSGARVFSTYGFVELGRVGMGCSNPVETNDLHLCTGICAMIPYEAVVPGTDIKVSAFNFTSLLPTAPMILLNTESDDYGVMETRSCGCPLDKLGLSIHLRKINSFHKLSGEGVTLIGSTMVEMLEEVLPALFGGTPLDYQMLEEEDEKGFTKLSLIISPEVKLKNENDVIGTLLSHLAKTSVMADSATDIWQQAQTLKIKRQQPRWTDRGKLMSLHVDRQHLEVARDWLLK